MPKKVIVSVKTKSKRTTRRRGVRGSGAYYPGGRVLRGQGGFFDDVGNALKGIAGPALGLVGGALDAVIPGASTITGGIRKLAGLGAYTPVHSNAILAQPVPKVGSEVDNGIRYHHEEYLGDITSSTGWELTQFHINPGLSETFPWLSTIASSFQKYRIDGLVMYVRSTSSVAISNTSDLGLGTLLGAFQYNVYDEPPQSKVEMLQLSGSLSGKPSEDHMYPLECAPGKGVMTNRLVRHTGVNDDLAKYDHATFNLATVGFPGEYALGELWISYNVLLMAPKVEDALQFCHTANTSADDMVQHVTTAAVVSGNSRYFSWVPKSLDESAFMRNTLAWKTTTYTDGLPVWQIPAGTAGYYQISAKLVSFIDTIFATSNETPEVTFEVQGSSGSVVNVDVPPFNRAAIPDMDMKEMFSIVVQITALPDRPLYFRINVPYSDGTDHGPVSGTAFAITSNFSITKLSDKWLPDTTTGSGVVSSRVKVVRSRNAAVANRLTASLSGAASATAAAKSSSVTVNNSSTSPLASTSQASSKSVG